MSAPDVSCSDGCGNSEESVSSQCGQPAVLDNSKVLLSSEVRSTVKNDDSVVVYEFSNDFRCKVIVQNDSDHYVSVACEELLAPHDPCINAATALGDIYSSIIVSCKTTDSYEEHARCQHDPTLVHPNSSKRIKLFRCVVCNHTEKTMALLSEHQRVIHHTLPPSARKPEKELNLMKSNCPSCKRCHILGKYRCKDCSFTSECPFALEGHLKEFHDSEHVYHCPCCDHSQRFYLAMEAHLFEKHCHSDKTNDGADVATEIRPLSAVNSGKKISSLKSTNCHEKETSLNEISDLVLLKDEPFLCCFCCGRFREFRTYHQHSCFSECLVCEKYCADSRELLVHYDSNHPELCGALRKAMFYHSMSTKNNVSVKQLIQYLKSSVPLDTQTYRHPVECDVECKVFRKNLLLKEAPNVTAASKIDGLLQCKICSHRPLCRKLMIQHLCEHTQHWPFSCRNCSRWFKLKSKALAHSKYCIPSNSDLNLSKVVIKMDILKKQNAQIVFFLFKFTTSLTVNSSSFESYQALYSLYEFWCDVCRFCCGTLEEIHLHLYEHTSPYECTGCDKKFANSRLTMNHIQEENCSGSVKLNKPRQMEYAAKLDVLAPECVTLVKFLPDDEALLGSFLKTYSILHKSITHFKTSTKKSSVKKSAKMLNILKCKLCLHVSVNLEDLSNHVIQHISARPWVCPICGEMYKLFRGLDNLHHHMIVNHPGIKPKYSNCVNWRVFKTQQDRMKDIIVELKTNDSGIDQRQFVHGTEDESVERLANVVNVRKRKQSIESRKDEPDIQEASSSKDASSSKIIKTNSAMNLSEAPCSAENARHENRGKSRLVTNIHDEKQVCHRFRTNTDTLPGPSSSRVGRLSIETFVCPQCKDFEGIWNDLILHYGAMHSYMAVCHSCDSSPCFHMVDYCKHMRLYHGHIDISDISARRADPKILARDLVEQLAQRARSKIATPELSTFVKSKLITVKMSTESGFESARFVCRRCSLTSRNADSFWNHIAEHLKISEFRCLHCSREANLHEMREHYRDHHSLRLSDILPYSLLRKRFRRLVDSVIRKLKQGENDSENSVSDKSQNVETKLSKAECSMDMKSESNSTLHIKSHLEIPNLLDDEWTFCFTCPYCDLETDDDLSQHKIHVELNHPRKQWAVRVDLILCLSKETANDIVKGNSSKYSFIELIKRDDPLVGVALNTDICQRLPDGFTLHEITTSEVLRNYNSSMMSLYNDFSILEIVAKLGGSVVCHLCAVNQETFPALFEHWSRHHLHLEPYICAFCGVKAKRPSTIVAHERRAHAEDCGNKYVINEQLYEHLFSTLKIFMKHWLIFNKVDSYIPEDIKLVKEPVIILKDIRFDEAYKKYFLID